MTTTTAARRLTTAELRTLTEVARGGGRDAVAARLGLSPLTVKSQLRNASKKLRARSTAHLVTIAIRTRQLPVDVAAGSEVTR
ncbi:LuxR C-terminal-related transcriptional regulator [Actinacidiphila rubida]|uniref:Regulatory protein, luxR family n=1 Tax=Actinacidiphila rubida TaxID=310780 RepID=A0A1H8SYC6_9ACTN|nr:LuxR C-terminal-related transcriptional regulator [Actinacidiphila rubida]SEO83203.1 regulatory protein, luxR family [Actinacidiphila rubida]